MHEILPIACGFALGSGLALLRRSLAVSALLVTIIAACATIASGEWQISASFLLVDLAEVVLSASLGYGVARLIAKRI